MELTVSTIRLLTPALCPVECGGFGVRQWLDAHEQP